MSDAMHGTAASRSEAEQFAAFRTVFTDALDQQQAGAVVEAIKTWRRALSLEPRSAEANFNLGVALRALGRPEEAMICFCKAIDLQPDNADAHNSLGNALRDKGRVDEAIACYRDAIRLQPDRFEAYTNLGDALFEQEQFEQAIPPYMAALRLKPDLLTALTRLGACLFRLDRLDEALDCLCTAVKCRLDDPEALFFLARTLHEQDRFAEAAPLYRAAIEFQPDLVSAYFNLAEAYRELGSFDAAVESAEKGIAIRSDMPGFHNVRGIALHAAGHVDEAMMSYRKAIEIDPDFHQAYGNMGNALRGAGQIQEALACFETAYRLKPDDPAIRYNRALLLLALGDYPAGWADYEYRWQAGQLKRSYRAFAQPQWKGEPAAGKALLIHAEQGFGDTLQFCRYATLAADRGLRVILEVQQPLLRLMGSLAGPASVIAAGSALPPFDLQCPMMSLPLALGTTLETIPASIPYLHPDESAVAIWKARLEPMCRGGLRVGLVWAGNPRPHLPGAAATDRRRSMPFERMAPLLEVPGVHFFSLQKTGAAAPPDRGLIDVMGEMKDFADTAALIANLDLVISVDTAVLHLAAAIGKPVWMLDRSDPCWRWLTDRRDSPWYPTLRIYRQPSAGDWDAVMSACAADLRALAPV